MYEGRKDKPQWNLKRIEEVIKMVEEYKSAPAKHENRNRKQYYYGTKYDIIRVGTCKTLVLKSYSESNTFVQIVPSEDYHSVLTECHKSTGHGRRDEILHQLKTKSFPYLRQP